MLENVSCKKLCDPIEVKESEIKFLTYLIKNDYKVEW